MKKQEQPGKEYNFFFNKIRHIVCVNTASILAKISKGIKNMKVNELTERLNEMEVARNVYSINSVEYPNEAYSIFWNGSEWEVYYSERGKKRGIKKFLG